MSGLFYLEVEAAASLVVDATCLPCFALAAGAGLGRDEALAFLSFL